MLNIIKNILLLTGKEGSIINSALDIAKYVINKCTSEKYPISNLQLQNILYYIQREFLQCGSIAFLESIEAWRCGVVVPEVYKQYCGFGALPIRMRYIVNIKQENLKIMNPIVEKKRLLKLWDMGSDICCQGKAWNLIYKNGLGEHEVIPQELIKSKG